MISPQLNRQSIVAMLIIFIVIIATISLGRAAPAAGIEANLSAGSGGIIYVTGSSCPAGWNAMTAAEGRLTRAATVPILVG